MLERRATPTSTAAAGAAVILAIACAGVALSSLDLLIVNVALPQISASFAA